MSMYTFFPCQADGGSIGLRARELNSDAEAMAFAADLLAEYDSCAYLAVWDGERAVGTCPQPAPAQTVSVDS